MSENRVIVLASNTSWYLYNFRKSTIKALIFAGYKPLCIAPEDEYSKKLIELGAQFEASGMVGESTNPFTEISTFLNLILLLRRLKPKFVFNFTIKMNIYAGLVCRLLGIPYSNNVSGLGTAFLHPGLVYKVAQYMYGISNRHATTVFFQNEDDMHLFLERGLAFDKRATLLPGSGVDIQEYSFQPMVSSDDQLVFLMIGRVIADKGVKEFVEAARIVNKKVPGTRFLLMGSWKISNKSAFDETTIDTWVKEGVVEFLGHQADAKTWIYECDVVVLPSYREGMPRTILEAASCGRPSIVTDVPGCRQAVIHDETGWLCEVRSAESLAIRMLGCIQLGRPSLLPFGNRARKCVETKFSDKIVVNEYLRLLNTVYQKVRS